MICFYNLNHIGDAYISASFINIITEQNSHLEFLFYFIQGDEFIKNNKNIKRINNLKNTYNTQLVNGMPPEDLLDKNILNFIKYNIGDLETYKISKINETNILFINTWCTPLGHIDFNYVDAINGWRQLINKINNQFNLNINFKINEPSNLLINNVELNNEKINETLTKLNINLDDCIFIFNYKPRSLIFDINQLNNTILEISKKQKVIISTYNSFFDGNSNIIAFDKEFNIYPDPYCKNLFYLWEIAIKCKNVILIPSGSCFTFFHKSSSINENQMYMFKSELYCNRLNENLYYFINKNNLIKNIN